MRPQASLIVRLLPGFDALCIAALCALTLTSTPRPQTAGLAITLLTVPVWITLFRYFGLYSSHRVEAVGSLFRRILTAHLVALVVGGAALYAANYRQEAADSVKLALFSFALVMTERAALYYALRALRRRGFDVRRVCVVGNWQSARRTAQMFGAYPEWGLQVACVGEGPSDKREFTSFSSGERLPYNSLDAVLTEEVIDEVLIAVSPDELAHEVRTMQLCEQYGLLARILLDSSKDNLVNPTFEPFCGEVSIATGSQQYSEAALAAKRALDILIGSIALIVCAPVLAVCAAMVKISSPGPVFFRQTRVGLHGRRFTILKFRTMVVGAESLLDAVAFRNSTKGPTFKDPRDARVTDLGRFMRRFSLDELPQLFMVLNGDMSLVGPRPLPVKESAAIHGEQRRRFTVRPGLTCLWQVNGRSDVEFARWMQYDLQYVDRWSLLLDAKLLLKTIPIVLSGRGAY